MEIWKDVVGYSGKYQVSNLGRVKSLKHGKWKILKNHLVIHKRKSRDYIQHQISLSIYGKKNNYFIHRLVYEAFNGLIPDGYQIDHINNNPQDNRLENLQLLTKSQNSKKRFIDNPLSAYKKKNVKRIMCVNNNKIYNSQSEASRQLNCCFQNISEVLKGKRSNTHGYKFIYVDEHNEDKKVQQLSLF